MDRPTARVKMLRKAALAKATVRAEEPALLWARSWLASAGEPWFIIRRGRACGDVLRGRDVYRNGVSNDLTRMFLDTGDTSWMTEVKYGLFMHYQYRILLNYSMKTEPMLPEQILKSGRIRRSSFFTKKS